MGTPTAVVARVSVEHKSNETPVDPGTPIFVRSTTVLEWWHGGFCLEPTALGD